MSAASRLQTTWRFEATGTQWQIEATQPLSADVQARILERVQTFEATWSRFHPDSLVAALAYAESGGNFIFPEEGFFLFDLYDRLHAVTGGAVDPLVGRTLERLGYDRTYSLRPVPDPNPPQPNPCWTRNVTRVGTTLTTRQSLSLDVGAAGKGLLVDLVAALLRQNGHTDFLVDGSGDLHHAGREEVSVGLEHPFEAGIVIGVVSLRNQALCASGVNRRAWGDNLHHVVDARSGQPTRQVVATWALADDALTADGLATALFFASPERLEDLFDFSGVRLFRDGRVEVSRNFHGEVFTA